MSLTDIIVLGMVFLAVILVSAWIIRRKKQGSGSCGCCPYRENCGEKPGG
jgi:hypothetical protein